MSLSTSTTKPVAKKGDFMSLLPKRQDTAAAIRLLLYGMPGCGKTYSCLTTAKNVLLIDANNNLTGIPASTEFGYAPIWDKNFREVALGNKKTMLSALKAVLNKEEVRKLGPESTIIIDSLSDIADEAADYFTQGAGCPLSKDGKKDTMRGWGVYHRYFADLMLIFQGLRANLIVIGHEADYMKEDNVIDKSRFFLHSQIANRFGQAFNFVFRAVYTTDKKRKWMTTPHAKHTYIKSAIPLPDSIEPDFSKLLEEVHKHQQTNQNKD